MTSVAQASRSGLLVGALTQPLGHDPLVAADHRHAGVQAAGVELCAFITEYIKDMNATQAAIRAGYLQKTAKSIGQKLLTKTDIKTEIDKTLSKIRKKNIADTAEIERFLTSLIRGEQKEETLAFQGEGVQGIKKIEVSAKDRIKAAELLGKRFGAWVDKQQIEHSGTIQFVDDIDETD